MSDLKIGFAKSDITPRVGVELAGFGPFLCRKSTSVRDNLFARAMAVQKGESHFILVSCDLIGLGLEQTRAIRKIVTEKTGLEPDAIMVHCTHTHSGPSNGLYSGWGEADIPYLELLPYRIAQACIDAWENLTPATVEYIGAPCEGIGLNREYDKDAPPLDEVLKDDWRPAKPELTDTTCHILNVKNSDGKMLGFAVYFGCHPVVCCAQNHQIHGDYCGVAMNKLSDEYDCIGMFIQGAQGDVNSCCVHKQEDESLKALDIIAERFAKAVRNGLSLAKHIDVDKVASCKHEVSFTRKDYTPEKIMELLKEYESRIDLATVSDELYEYRMNMVYITALQDMLLKAETGKPLAEPTEIQAVRLGPITITASGFETFQDLKNQVLSAKPAPITLVAGLTNDTMGYAPDKTAAERGGYAADVVPFIVGQVPFAKIYEELPAALINAARQIN